MLGTQKWSGGPTFALVARSGQWTYGGLWNQMWSFAGSADRADVSQMFAQPFLSYTTRSAVTIGVNLEATANWKKTDSRWTAPMNAQVSKLSALGPLPTSYTFGFGWFVERPDGAPRWQLRSAITLLMPKGRRDGDRR